MSLQRAVIPLKTKQGRVYAQRRESNPYFPLENHGLTNIVWPAASLTAIRAQSTLQRTGSWMIDLVEGDTEMPTFSLPTYVQEVRNFLMSIAGEKVNIQLITGTSGAPTQYSGDYGLGWFFARRGAATTAVGAIADNAGEGGPLTFETPFTAIMGPIPIDWTMALALKTSNAAQISAGWGVYCLPPLVDETEAKAVLPGEVGMIVGDSAVGPALAELVYFTDGLVSTPTACAADPFAAGRGARSVVGYGDKLNPRFIVSSETLAGTDPGISYTDDYGATWVAGTVTGGATNVDEMTKLWIIHAGRIYACGGQAGSSKVWMSIDGGATWAETDLGLAQPMNDIQVAGNGIGYAVGAANVIARVDDFDSWSTLTGPAAGAGDDLLAVAIKISTGTLFIGNDAGELYVSNDKGVTWTTETSRIQGVTATSINHIEFDPMTGEFGYMEITTATPARVKLRSTNGGVTWLPYSLGAPAGVNIATNGMHVVGPNHVLYTGALVAAVASIVLGQSQYDGSRML